MSQLNKNNSQPPMRGRNSDTYVRAAAGGGLGAVLGSILIPIPGVGAAIGGAIGAAIGGYSGDKSDRSAGR